MFSKMPIMEQDKVEPTPATSATGGQSSTQATNAPGEPQLRAAPVGAQPPGASSAQAEAAGEQPGFPAWHAIEPDEQSAGVRERVAAALTDVYDPEIPVNIFELGLIYKINEPEPGHIDVVMTLTSPMCPVAESLPPEVEQKVRTVDGVTGANVEVVWDPPWTPTLMSEAAKLQLNMF